MKILDNIMCCNLNIYNEFYKDIIFYEGEMRIRSKCMVI